MPEEQDKKSKRARAKKTQPSAKKSFQQLVTEFNRAQTIADMTRVHRQIEVLLTDLPSESQPQ